MNVAPNFVKEGKLIVALTASEIALMQDARNRLTLKFGDCELVGDVFPFDFTHYYEQEMGASLQKQFLSFARMIPLEDLAAIKVWTNALEQGYAVNGKRRINLDPGYVTHAQMVLATTKDYTHRIYLGQGIHAELTYLCRKRVFQIMEWTYPDYRTPPALAFFERVRHCYLHDMRVKREVGMSEKT